MAHITQPGAKPTPASTTVGARVGSLFNTVFGSAVDRVEDTVEGWLARAMPDTQAPAVATQTGTAPAGDATTQKNFTPGFFTDEQFAQVKPLVVGGGLLLGGLALFALLK